MPDRLRELNKHFWIALPSQSVNVMRSLVIGSLVLVDKAMSVMYGIQITRSPDPFAEHKTFDTASKESTSTIENLARGIKNGLELVPNLKLEFVMVAPNCAGGRYTPPAGHLSSYLFYPPSLVPDIPQLAGRARTSRKRPRAEQQATESNKRCCRCTTGSCENCSCQPCEESCRSVNCHYKLE